jgi:2,3,4,5-tetrahydropyridine-2-carboxylate N-succinyltransferase
MVKNVHLRWCYIGGVLEPLQAAPVIIEDGALLDLVVSLLKVFMGKEAVLGANVCLTASTKLLM